MSSCADPIVGLLEQARGGDLGALGRLLEGYRDYLTLLARVQIGRRLRGKVDAADLAQETFLEAHRAFGRFRGATEGELAAWLREILAATISHLLRRYCGTEQRDIRLERSLAEELDQSSRVLGQALAAPGSSPSQQAARREQAVLLANALKQLPSDYSDVIILRHLEGLSFAEVGERMGRSVDSVKKLWIRALDQLRALMGAAP
jgi:RNA polymerase sigma-70 factor, ECF subfamily